jgi:FkbM family methyltransferase
MNLIRNRSKFLSIKVFLSRILTSKFISFFVSLFHRKKIGHRGTIINLPNDNLIKSMLFWHLYESSEFRYLKKYFRNEMDCIEFGSSIGVLTSYIISNLNNEKLLICVEANPTSFEFLNLNLVTNGQSKKFVSYNNAVGYSSDYLKIEKGKNNLVSNVLNSDLLSNSTEYFSIPTITLRQILVNNQIIGWYQLVCDIEGSEVELILNDYESFVNCAILILETHQVTFKGNTYSTQLIINMIHEKTDLRLIERNGEICVFMSSKFS